MHFTLERKEKIYDGKIINLSVHTIGYPSGEKGIREVVEHPGGAAIAALFGNGDILLVNQYRHPVEKKIFELPAGKLDYGENPLHCAQRELTEETGYTAGKWTKMTSFLSTPGFCDEVLHIFLAEEISASEKGQALDEGEQSLTVKRMHLSEAIRMIYEGTIIDGKTIIGILMAERIVTQR